MATKAAKEKKNNPMALTPKNHVRIMPGQNMP